MEIVTVQFNYPGRPDYNLLLQVFKESVNTYMPKVKFIEFKIDPPPNKTNRPLNFNYNDVKLKIWRDYMLKTKDNVIFADCDMMMVQSAKHAFDIDFDVAFTARTIVKRIPMNGGIFMARPTNAARKFLDEWYKINHKMLHDVSFHHQWRRRYAGMNQSAFGYLYENGRAGAKVHKYITREWNAVDCDWHHINKKTVFVHYKSKLRKLVLKNVTPQGSYKIAMNLWYNMRNQLKRKEFKIKRKLKK